MMPAIDNRILAVSGSLPLSTLAKATIAVALALAASSVARRARAAVRHSMLAVTFGVLLALPAVSALAPPIRVAMQAAAPGSTAAARVLPVPPAGSPAAPLPSRYSVADLLLAAWIAGAALFLAPVALGLWQVRSLRRSALPCALAGRIVDTPGVTVLLHEDLAGPMTCGFVRPAILLPADAPEWRRDDLERAIVHESEHVRRGDWAVHCIARLACALYWFHPLVWMAWRRLELEAERACDDAVVARSEATAYADQLVSVARKLSAKSKSPLLAMASRSDLGTRVNALLDGRQRRGRAGTRFVTVAATIAVALIATLSPLRMVGAPQQANGSAGGPTLRAETNLVITDVVVTYPSGKTIEGLTANDFSVTENGAPQRIALFEDHNADGGYYLLGYYAAGTREKSEFRKVAVTVKNASTARVELRAGYYSGPPADVALPAGAAESLIPGTRPPMLLYKKEPEYSEEARKAKYQGTVILRVDVDDTGHATNIKVVRSLGLGLDEKAIEAVQQWRFKPGTRDGKPVTVQTNLLVSFRLL